MPSNGLDANEVDSNLIHFTRFNYQDDYYSSEDEDSSEDSCEGCYEDIVSGHIPISHEMGNPGHRHYNAYRKYQEY